MGFGQILQVALSLGIVALALYLSARSAPEARTRSV